MPARLIYNRATLRTDLALMRAHLPGTRIFYAAKACSERPILKELAALGLEFEVAGAEEMQSLLDIGVDPGRIICGLPMKGPALIKRMYGAGCRVFTFDCPEEFADLLRYAPDALSLLRIGVQDLDNGSIGWGMTPDGFEAWVSDQASVLKLIDGVSFHLSRNYRLGLIEKTLDRAEAVLDRLQCDAAPVLNIGGGYRTELPPHLALKFDLDRYYDQLSGRLAALRARRPVQIWAEPGRALVERAARLCTPVLQVQTKAHESIVSVELNIGTKPGAHPAEIAALNESGRENLYTLATHLEPGSQAFPTIVFVDATCEFFPFYQLPLRRIPRVGEMLEFTGLGAYTGCLSSRFHGRSFPNTMIE